MGRLVLMTAATAFLAFQPATSLAAGAADAGKTVSDIDGYTIESALKDHPIVKATPRLVSAARAAGNETPGGSKKQSYLDNERVGKLSRAGMADVANRAADAEVDGTSPMAAGELGAALQIAAAEKEDRRQQAEAEAERKRQERKAREKNRRNRVIELAESRLGVPYVWGGTDPEGGMDCSGFTQWVYSRMGIDIPRTTESQLAGAKETVPLSEAKPGDILYSAGHVGIYAGGDKYIHEPQSGDVCRYAEGIGSFSCALRYL